MEDLRLQDGAVIQATQVSLIALLVQVMIGSCILNGSILFGLY